MTSTNWTINLGALVFALALVAGVVAIVLAPLV